MRSIKTEIILNAGREKVWKHLTDFASYPYWNPFITKIEGKLETGSRLNVTLQLEGRKPSRLKPKILIAKHGEKFCWKGALFFSGLFDGTHYFILEDTEDGKTRLIHGENFSGLLSGLILYILENATREGFERMNKALQMKVEE
jgi:hypothetical protein